MFCFWIAAVINNESAGNWKIYCKIFKGKLVIFLCFCFVLKISKVCFLLVCLIVFCFIFYFHLYFVVVLLFKHWINFLLILVWLRAILFLQCYTPVTKVLFVAPTRKYNWMYLCEKGLRTQEAIARCFRNFQYFDKNDGSLCSLLLHLFFFVLKTN